MNQNNVIVDQAALYTFTCSLSLLSRSFRLLSSSQVI